jgi:hypothetical protein
MAVSIKSIAIIVAALGVKAFVFGILAEIKKVITLYFSLRIQYKIDKVIC